MRADAYWTSINKQFAYYKALGEGAFAQLDDQELFWRYHPDANSIGIIVQHLWGNMLSRWTDFLSSDGEKAWRDRDGEFAAEIETRHELLARWDEGWQCLFDALASAEQVSLDTVVIIRNQRHTVIEAVHRQMMHYAYHVGQIVLLGVLVRGAAWKSLSIPKGGSVAFNAEKLAKGQHGGHFTDDLY